MSGPICCLLNLHCGANQTIVCLNFCFLKFATAQYFRQTKNVELTRSKQTKTMKAQFTNKRLFSVMNEDSTIENDFHKPKHQKLDNHYTLPNEALTIFSLKELLIFNLNEAYFRICLMMQRAFHSNQTCQSSSVLKSNKTKIPKQCNYNRFIKLIEDYCYTNIDYSPPGRLTLLYISVIFGQHKVLKYLLERGANHNATFMQYFTPIHVCARSGYTKCLKLLLDHGANLFSGTAVGNHAIHVAATYGQIDCIKLLLQYGENINNNLTRNGITPLHCSIANRQSKTTRWLLENGADPTIGRYDMEEAFIAVAEDRENTIVFNSAPPIHVACRYNSVDCLKTLLEYNVDINTLDENGRTPLHTACLFKSSNVVKLLLKENCKLNEPDRKNYKPLGISFCLDDESSFMEMLKNTNPSETELCNVLSRAFSQNKSNIVNALQSSIRSE